jgi:hypothetical protein
MLAVHLLLILALLLAVRTYEGICKTFQPQWSGFISFFKLQIQLQNYDYKLPFFQCRCSSSHEPLNATTYVHTYVYSPFVDTISILTYMFCMFFNITFFLFGVSDPLCLSSSSALHFFPIILFGPPPC